MQRRVRMTLARMLVIVTLGTALAGCATVNRGGGVSGAAAVSGESKSERAETGAATDNIAASGSETSGAAPVR
jgi:hypothetical protein